MAFYVQAQVLIHLLIAQNCCPEVADATDQVSAPNFLSKRRSFGLKVRLDFSFPVGSCWRFIFFLRLQGIKNNTETVAGFDSCTAVMD